MSSHHDRSQGLQLLTYALLVQAGDLLDWTSDKGIQARYNNTLRSVPALACQLCG